MVRGRRSSPLTQNTDMTQSGTFADIVVPTQKEGDPLGQTQALENQVDSVATPIDEQSALVSGTPNAGALPQPINISAPTNNQFEPNTAGIPVGPGDNGPRVIPTNTLQNFLIAAKELTKDPIFDELLAEDIITQPIRGDDAEDYIGI